MKKRSGKNTLELIKLRLMLLRIWFMKNLMTFVKVLIAVVFVLMLFGQINENTPVLGFIVYPILKPLIDSINDIVATRDAGSFMGFASAALSILITISLFTIKLKSISQNDIKNKELKIAMVRAGLYFNENGKLVKKVEKAIGTDINGDGVVDENDVIKSEGFFKGIGRAISEFVTVITTDIGEDETAKEKLAEAAESIDATDTKEALDDIDEIVVTSTLDRASEMINRTFDKAIDDAEKADIAEDGELNKTEGLRKKNSIINMIRSGCLGVVNTTKNIFIRSKDNANEEDGEEEMDDIITNEVVEETPDIVVSEDSGDAVVTKAAEKTSNTAVVKETSKNTDDTKTAIMRKFM